MLRDKILASTTDEAKIWPRGRGHCFGLQARLGQNLNEPTGEQGNIVSCPQKDRRLARAKNDFSAFFTLATLASAGVSCRCVSVCPSVRPLVRLSQDGVLVKRLVSDIAVFVLKRDVKLQLTN